MSKSKKSFKTCINNFFSNRNILIIMVFFTVAFAIVGISMTIVGHPSYVEFIKAAANAKPNISIFVYGTFFISMAIILIFMDILFANSTYNKKMKTL